MCTAPMEITKPSILFVEGLDAKFFCICACSKYQIQNVQVIDFGGNQDLPKRLALLLKTPGFSQVKTLIIIRDAEEDATVAIQNIKNALLRLDLCAPDGPGILESGTPSVGYYIFPGSNSAGTLEDFCLATLEGEHDAKHLECVDNFLSSVKEIDVTVHEKKSKLHAYLASKKEFVGLKIGEATKANAWKLDSSACSIFREFLVNSIGEIDT